MLRKRLEEFVIMYDDLDYYYVWRSCRKKEIIIIIVLDDEELTAIVETDLSQTMSELAAVCKKIKKTKRLLRYITYPV